MIIVNIKNGLANQMFQYAFGRVLEWKYNTLVLYDFMRNNSESALKSDLDVFSIENINEADTELVEPFKPFSVRKYRDEKKYLQYIYYKIRRKCQTNKLITEPYPSKYMKTFNKLDVNNKYYFLGFWQNPRYFKGFENEIHKLFIPRDQSIFQTTTAKEIRLSKSETVSIHFRRGDYLTSDFIEPLPMSYYHEALKYIRQKVNNPFFYIFSDDPDWVASEFNIKNCKIITENTGADSYKDIILMSLCKHNIIANSSFSWWGGYLNRNPSKVVIAPIVWFASRERNKFSSQITPENWIRL